MSTIQTTRKRRQVVIGTPDMLPGERRIIDVEGRSIGLFNVAGDYYALHNRCPHMAGPLCEGPVTGTALETDRTEFIYGREGELVRCGWHGWEFEIKTGMCLVNHKMRTRRYPVTVENGALVIHI